MLRSGGAKKLAIWARSSDASEFADARRLAADQPVTLSPSLMVRPSSQVLFISYTVTTSQLVCGCVVLEQSVYRGWRQLSKTLRADLDQGCDRTGFADVSCALLKNCRLEGVRPDVSQRT